MENPLTWSDLPSDLVNRILDRLPLLEYIRFPVVCPKWNSVHIDHRCHHRLPSYPWLIPSYIKQEDQEVYQGDDRQKKHVQEDAVPCFSPFEGRLYRLPNLPIPFPSHFCCASSNGWILLQQLNYDKDVNPSDIEITGNSRRRRKTRKQIKMRRNWPPPLPKNILSFYLLNPILNLRISLHPIRLKVFSPCYAARYYAAISDSGRHALVTTDDRELFLLQQGSQGWIAVPPSSHRLSSFFQAVYFREKFYCYCLVSGILIIDPHHPTLSIEHLNMDTSQMPTPPPMIILLESDGQLLLVHVLRDLGEIEGFRVFKADLSNKTWEPMESLGDRMLLLARNSSISLVADAIGGRRNCIYYSDGSIGNLYSSSYFYLSWSRWKIFDLGSQSITYWPLLDTMSERDCVKIRNNDWRWILPSIARV